MKPGQRVMLDKRIAEEGFVELDPHGEKPFACDWYRDGDTLHAWTMRSDGTADKQWQLVDEVDWTDVVAVRLEDRLGNPIDPNAEEEEMDEDAEPES